MAAAVSLGTVEGFHSSRSGLREGDKPLPAVGQRICRHTHRHDAHAALGDREDADAALREALDLYRSQRRTADADRIERKLAAGLASGESPY